MAVKAWGTQPKAIDEIFFRNEAVSLCLLVNRRARTMRIIDFRAGPHPAKRLFVLSLAQREGVAKILILVERDEVQTWVKLGFAKEGTIPGFYKRSDAFILGCSASASLSPRRSDEPGDGDDVPGQSEMRMVAAGAAAPMSPAQARMERTIAAAKRDTKNGPVPAVKIGPASEDAARKAIAAALRSGRALTAFEAFGRDVERRAYVAIGRGGFELYASVESQSCFSNAYIELLEAPKNDAEKLATAGAIRALCAELEAQGVVSCFALAPSDDTALAWAYLENGFRRTGLLLGHLVSQREPGDKGRGDTRTDPRTDARTDAIVWSRKLASAADE
jgi:hypothetical protein